MSANATRDQDGRPNPNGPGSPSTPDSAKVPAPKRPAVSRPDGAGVLRRMERISLQEWARRVGLKESAR